jgi:hypothetical protein
MCGRAQRGRRPPTELREHHGSTRPAQHSHPPPPPEALGHGACWWAAASNGTSEFLARTRNRRCHTFNISLAPDLCAAKLRDGSTCRSVSVTGDLCEASRPTRRRTRTGDGRQRQSHEDTKSSSENHRGRPDRAARAHTTHVRSATENAYLLVDDERCRTGRTLVDRQDHVESMPVPRRVHRAGDAFVHSAR